MGKPKAPRPPDPRETAAAQTGTNIATALANAQLGNVGQVTPYGSVRYDQTGTYEFRDPTTGATYDIPQYTAVTELSPGQRRIFENLQTAAGDISGRLGTPFELGNEAVEGRLFELGRARLDPRFEQQRAMLEQDLANRGIRIGSDAYQTAIEQQRQAEADAYNQLLLSGRGQATQELLLERTQPINELTAILSGQQVTQPNFQALPQQPQIPTVDYAGLQQANYQNQFNRYRQQQAQQQAVLGGLFGLGSALLL